ncbi:hypothetical protein CEXT_339791 [Caerostris extrusa]|uniref:Uncharacterized protein n=1 Tax=Caerostris extrusa TaxID=172846 RepID=A0AAV4XIW7_CAEEX|nr:hypothetical protein CEXT_339791 [Caerostris extrusa]
MHAEFPIERVKQIVPQSTLRMNSGVFESETTNKSQFQEWGIERPKPVRPVPNLTQEGSMDFTTMNKLQFEEKPIQKVQQFRPKTQSKIEGEFDGTTTNQVMFTAQTQIRPNVIKPKGNLELEKGKFASETTNNSEFQPWKNNNLNMKYASKGEFASQTTNLSEFQQWQQQSKPEIVIRRDNLHQEGSVDFTTTNQTQFGQNVDSVERYQVIKPKDNLVLQKTTNLSEFQQYQQQSKPEIVIRRDNLHQEGSVDYNTTHKTEFGKTTSVERPHVVKPKGNLELEKGKFASESTTHYEFQQKQQQPKQKIVTRKG